jgi:hypothetical protein
MRGAPSPHRDHIPWSTEDPGRDAASGSEQSAADRRTKHIDHLATTLSYSETRTRSHVQSPVLCEDATVLFTDTSIFRPCLSNSWPASHSQGQDGFERPPE